LRFEHERAGHGHALLLAAGELVRQARREAVEPELFQHVMRLGPRDLIASHAGQRRP
jgi:hypothetical protein